MLHQYVKILLILGMVAAMCGITNAAMGIVAETQTTSSGSTPVCSSPCECISEAEAASRWGAEGYDRCSKTICGQSANAMVQYYCFHQIGGVSSVSKSGTTAPITTNLVLTMPTTTPAPVQTAAQTIVQTQVQAPAATATAAAANPSPSYTWPSPGATPQRTPVSTVTVLVAIGIVLLLLVAIRKE